MNPTSIAWVRGPDGAPGFTWSPVVGCTPCSSGCRSCWAARLASTRLAHLPDYKGLAKDGKWIGGARFLPDRLGQPLHKRNPAGIAVSLMGDLFHESITNEQIAAVFGVMAVTPKHRYFILSKRAKRMREWFQRIAREDCGPWTECHWQALCVERDNVGDGGPIHTKGGKEGGSDRRWPLSNVFVGVSIEDQATADERIPELLQTPAAVRFVSAEPLLGPVDLRSYLPSLDWLVVGGES